MDQVDRIPEWADPAVPTGELDPQGVSRRGLLRTAGLFGTGFAATAVGGPLSAPSAAAATSDDCPDLVYLVGDHHVHSVFSPDAKYRMPDLARRAAQFGLDWMVFTEHSNVGHAEAGGADQEHEQILNARTENPRLLIFQGLEWYIPAAEHATVFTAPGPNEVAVLREFERTFDAKLLGRSEGALTHPDTAANEAFAATAIRWLGAKRRSGYVPDALIIANHPSRLGIDSPHELRAWRDADPDIMIGMEGAPGAQGAAMPGVGGASSVRGEYQNKPSGQSWPGYPLATYTTYGGFDWMTATVGGLWDAMLSEGRLFTITSNSDNHRTVLDRTRNGDFGPGQTFETVGHLPDPVETGTPQPGSDFWPGQFSRTHVGVTRYGYRDVMAGLRAGRVWVDHGQLVDGLDVRLEAGRARATLGGRLRVRRGQRLTLTVTVASASRPNLHGDLPRLAHLDVIRGRTRRSSTAADGFVAPDTRVEETVDTRRRTGTYTLRIPLGAVRDSGYVRLRGSDGRRNGPGLRGRAVDPHGPLPHSPGAADPWADTWLYTNPIFVDVT
jgi:PHP domain-containing protein